MNFFRFELSDNGDLILYYDDRIKYPYIYIDNLGEVICEYEDWYPDISIDNTGDAIYTYNNDLDKKNIVINNDGNIIMEVAENDIEFSKMFTINTNGDLIYTFDEDPLNLFINEQHNIVLRID